MKQVWQVTYYVEAENGAEAIAKSRDEANGEYVDVRVAYNRRKNDRRAGQYDRTPPDLRQGSLLNTARCVQILRNESGRGESRCTRPAHHEGEHRIWISDLEGTTA